ncbi:MAG: MarR family transcriptional regulator [bacterium]|nr:MarR family transcriptional regulator [bacterium]
MSRRKLTAAEEAFINLLRTADVCQQELAALLKGYRLSATQYNVLRILRGAGKAGLPCGEVGSRLITRDPDITRLLDRMEARGLVTRERQTADRRVIIARITGEGLRLVNSLDKPIGQLHSKVLGHLGEKNLRKLIGLLEEARDRGGQTDATSETK